MNELHVAVGKGNIEEVKHLIRNGADVNAKGHEGDTPLHLAAKYSIECYSIECTEILIKAGADINARNNSDETPLDIAKGKNIKLIIEHGGILNNIQRLEKIMSRFMKTEDVKILKLLCNTYKTNLDEKDLMYKALDSKNYKSIKLFLEKGISFSYFDKNNKPFIHNLYLCYLQNSITQEQYCELSHIGFKIPIFNLFAVFKSFSSFPYMLANKILAYNGLINLSEKQIDNIRTEFEQKSEKSRDHNIHGQGR